jgi:signal transduction histidine kinase/ActR/RegA family two-component response regulator
MLVALALGLVSSGAAWAAPPAEAARQLADAIEHRADATSFSDLQRFGEQASRQSGREALRRLHHVAFIMLNQSEFDQFEHFNGLLAAKAKAQDDARYVDIARLDELKSKFDRGDTSVLPQIAAMAEHDSDWFARVHAIVMQALILGSNEEAGASLKRLFEAESLVPAEDVDGATAESDIWETIGIQLIELNDLDGSAAAFQKADFDLADKSYPRPDFDDVYNMAILAAKLGDGDLARYIATVHHRLTLRSDLPHLGVWDKYLCADVAESFQAPKDVSDCLAGIDAHLTGAEFLAPRLLSLRGIAAARQGRPDEARADLAGLQRLQASNQFAASAFERMPELQAEVLAADGKGVEAFALLRSYNQHREADQARHASFAVRQVTAELERQLRDVEHREALETDVVQSQRWVVILGALLVLGAAATLIWQRRLAARLSLERQKAELASRSKSEFLANMSHEIRTPLNGVVGVADMLAQAGLPERERKMAEIIRSSGQSLERLLTDVLDLARVEAGQLTVEMAPFNAADLVRAVAALCRLRADEKGLALSAQIDPAVEHWFTGDAVRVRQILTNLTSNAVKFTERGRVTLSAQMTAPGVLRFQVWDTGVGFSAEVKERLFSRFQQADGSITRRFGGSGLGLAISRQLAALMGGVVDCESEEGRGSRFWFEARFAAAEAPPEAAAPDAVSVAQGRPIRILLADDHATNQMVVKMMLDQFGIESRVVDNGAEAVEAVRRERFDAVLMDMQMPLMGGLEATRLIRHEEMSSGAPHLPILMLSANALAEHREAGRLAGADGHVPKPVTITALMAALNAVLEPEDAEPVLAAAG